MNVESVFSENYLEAKEKFAQVVSNKKGKFNQYKLNDKYSIDTAYFGNVLNQYLIIISSGMHGVEGYAGSALQIDMIENFDFNSLNTSFLFIHGINPYGMENFSRTNENNVDLNRNFINFKQVPENENYKKYNKIIVSKPGLKKTLKLSKAALIASIRKENAVEALTKGQYEYEDGIYYGGKEPQKETEIVQQIFKDFNVEKYKSFYIGYHTGIGKSGKGVAISLDKKDSKKYKKVQNIFGENLKVENLASTDMKQESLSGDFTVFIDKEYNVLAVDVEFGTPRTGLPVITSLARDAYTRKEKKFENDKKRIKKTRESFYPKYEKWKKKVLEEGKKIQMSLKNIEQEL